MRHQKCILHHLVVMVCLFFAVCESKAEITSDLAALDAMRKGRETPADAVESRGAELLKLYPGGDEQGQIYFHLAHILAQSGMMRPEKIQEYARKALKSSLEPNQRLTLYVYLGDSYRAKLGTWKEFPEKRREATIPYLEGLNEASKLNLPENTIGLQSDLIEPTQVQESSNHQKTVKLQELCKLRDVLTNQIVTIYNQRPFATEEIKALSFRIVQDEQVQKRLLSQVEEAVALVGPPKSDADRVLAGEVIKSSPTSGISSWWLQRILTTTVVTILLAFVAFYTIRQRKWI